MRAKRKGELGSALIELTCALFVVTLGVLGVLQMYSVGMDKTNAVNEYAIALRAVDNELETLRTLPFEELSNGKHPFRSRTPELERLVRAAGTVTVTDYPGVQGLKEVHVFLRWTGEHGRIIEKQLTTLISKKR